MKKCEKIRGSAQIIKHYDRNFLIIYEFKSSLKHTFKA
jgi:hypothetical protein